MLTVGGYPAYPRWVERDEEGNFLLTESEAEVARAALFVAIHHRDDIVGHCDGCFQTISGVEATALPDLMREFDERNGHAAAVEAHLLGEMEKRALRDDASLDADTGLKDILRAARERGLPIPPRLADRGEPFSAL